MKRQVLYARALLLLDCGTFSETQWSVEQAAVAVGLSSRPLEHLKERFVKYGLDAALERKKPIIGPLRELEFDGEFAARLIQLACSEVPEGRSRWTIRLLGHRCYVHLFYNEAKKAQANDDFMFNLLQYKEKREAGLSESDRHDFYERFLTVSETSKRGIRVTFREELIRAYRERHSGVFVLLSNSQKDPMDALDCYRNKDVIEKSFDNLKSEEDCKRLRMHSDQTAESKLFVCFLALILVGFIPRCSRRFHIESIFAAARKAGVRGRA